MAIWTVKEINELKKVPYLDSISFHDCELLLNLDFFDAGIRVIKFESCLAFRVIQEGYALKTLGQQEFLGINWLFTTIESNFIDWFDQETEEMYGNSFRQFIIVSHNEIIEVITNYEPIITLA